jgi:hypothetical protein
LERGEITVDHVSLPETSSEFDSTNGNMFELLFSQVYDYNDSVFGFTEVAITTMNRMIQDRLMIKRFKPKCYISDPEGANLENLTAEELAMMDLLLLYRETEGTDLTNVSYGELESKLSKLIYIYLDVMVNNEYRSIDLLDALVSTDRIIENMFEIYVVNECHKKLKLDTVIVGSLEERLKPVRKRFDVDAAMLVNKSFLVTDPLPYSFENVSLYYNGRLVSTSLYTLEYDPPAYMTSVIVVLSDDLYYAEGGKFVIDYYTRAVYTPTTPIVNIIVDEENEIHDYEVVVIEDDEEDSGDDE